MTVLDKLLNHIETGWTVTSIDVGENWILSQVQHTDGRVQAGVAATPRIFPKNPKFPVGSYPLDLPEHIIIQGLLMDDTTASAVGLATLNAVNAPDESMLTTEDAADWLSAKAKGRNIAIFGRFPFIEDEIRPFANNVFVFEQIPENDEYTAEDMPEVLPQTDIIAITGTTIINHTLDDILRYTTNKQTVVVLGPSTPLTPQLFDFRVDALFGVRVADVDAVKKSVHAHLGFQKIQGLQRVSLFRLRKRISVIKNKPYREVISNYFPSVNDIAPAFEEMKINPPKDLEIFRHNCRLFIYMSEDRWVINCNGTVKNQFVSAQLIATRPTSESDDEIIFNTGGQDVDYKISKTVSESIALQVAQHFFKTGTLLIVDGYQWDGNFLDRDDDLN